MKPLFAIVVAVACAAPSHAAQDDWARVRGLPAGTLLVITTTTGSELRGRLELATADGVVLAAGQGPGRRIARAEIQTVIAVHRDSVWNGVLAGAALGFAGGSGAGAAWFYGSGRYGAKPPGYAREFITGAGALGGIAGAVIGWRIDAARSGTEVVYEAQSSVVAYRELLDSLGYYPGTALVREYVLNDGSIRREYATDLPLEEAATAVSVFYRDQLLARQWKTLQEHAAASAYSNGADVLSVLRFGPELPQMLPRGRLIESAALPPGATFFFGVQVGPEERRRPSGAPRDGRPLRLTADLGYGSTWNGEGALGEGVAVSMGVATPLARSLTVRAFVDRVPYRRDTSWLRFDGRLLFAGAEASYELPSPPLQPYVSLGLGMMANSGVWIGKAATSPFGPGRGGAHDAGSNTCGRHHGNWRDRSRHPSLGIQPRLHLYAVNARYDIDPHLVLHPSLEVLARW